MAWLRYSDGHNRQPEIHALDDGSYRALQCLIEAAENYDACGMAIDSYAVGFYPHARQKLRSEIRKLADRGLVHFLQSPDDRDHDCPTCQTRWEELRGEAGEELREKLGTSSTTSTQSSKTEPMWFCIRNFFDVALTPEQKRNTKQGNAKRQQAKRKKDKAAESRRDAQPPSHPPVPVPDPKLRIIDRVPLSEEPEPPSTAGPSELSRGTADRDAGSRLRAMLDERWPNAKHWEHFDEIQRLAEQEPGDPVATLAVAMNAFDADTSQQKYRHSPQGLIMHWNRYVADHREQIKATEGKSRAAAAEQRHQKAKADAEAKHWEKVQAKQQRGGKPLALAELMQSISGGKV
jgi:hypothetical protein